VGVAVAGTSHMKKRSEWLKKIQLLLVFSQLKDLRRQQQTVTGASCRIKRDPHALQFVFVCLVEDKSLKGGVMKERQATGRNIDRED
jgi:hypothetical protein